MNLLEILPPFCTQFKYVRVPPDIEYQHLILDPTRQHACSRRHLSQTHHTSWMKRSALPALHRTRASNRCFVPISCPVFISFLLRHLALISPGHANFEFIMHWNYVYKKSTMIPAVHDMAFESQCSGKP
jgi:hypothetical protein